MQTKSAEQPEVPLQSRLIVLEQDTGCSVAENLSHSLQPSWRPHGFP